MQKLMKITTRVREERGSRAAGRVRRQGEVPGNLCGGGKEPTALALPTHDVEVLHRSGAHLVTLDFGAEQVEALVRGVQFDSIGRHMLHVDFDRIVAGQKVELEIDLHFFGVPKIEGAVFQVLMDAVKVRCLPGAIPDHIEADVSAMKKGSELRFKDLRFPEGVEPVGQKGEEIVALLAEVKEELAAPVTAEPGPSEPEVITARAKDEEGAEEEKD